MSENVSSSNKRTNEYIPTSIPKNIILDRDGTIIKDTFCYIKSIDEVEFLDGALEALSIFRKLNIDCYMLSNQACVGKEIITRDELRRIHNHIVDTIKEHNGKIIDTFYCIHDYTREKCNCRKPMPGGIFTLASVHGFLIPGSLMIGDRYLDVEAGIRAGCEVCLLKEEDDELYQTARNILEIAHKLERLSDEL